MSTVALPNICYYKASLTYKSLTPVVSTEHKETSPQAAVRFYTIRTICPSVSSETMMAPVFGRSAHLHFVRWDYTQHLTHCSPVPCETQTQSKSSFTVPLTVWRTFSCWKRGIKTEKSMAYMHCSKQKLEKNRWKTNVYVLSFPLPWWRIKPNYLFKAGVFIEPLDKKKKKIN